MKLDKKKFFSDIVFLSCLFILGLVIVRKRFIVLGYELEQGEECTVGDAMGNATTDGRPISWKNRDSSNNIHFVKYITGGTYGVLGMGYGSSFDLKMGVNEAGLSLQNSLCDNLDGIYSYDDFKMYILQERSSVADVRTAMNDVYNGTDTYWLHYPGNDGPAICSGFSDAQGKVSLFELNDHFSPYFYEYNPEDQDRLVQFPQQIIVRSNIGHRNPSGLDDDLGTGSEDGRDYNETVDLFKFYADITKEGINPQNLIQNISRNGEPGVDSLPCRLRTQAAMLVHGVNAGEDKRIVTAWLGLGNPDYTIFVPAWTAQKANLSSRVTSAASSTIGYLAVQLLNKRDSNNYDQYINGLFLSVENNIFEAVDMVRSKWFSYGFSLDEATRLHNEAAETAWQTMNSMNAGSSRSLNPPPNLTSIVASINGSQVSFSVNASDPNYPDDGADDGYIASYNWDFGDGNSSTQASPSHSYGANGTYLVRCRVTDNNGARNSKWKYVTIGSIPLPSSSPISYPSPSSSIAPSSSPSPGTTSYDLNQDGSVDGKDVVELLSNWYSNIFGIGDYVKDNLINTLDFVTLIKYISSPPPSEPLVFNPTQDATCNSGSADTNYGTASSLEVDNSPVKYFYLKFNVTNIPLGANIQRAYLRLYCVNNSNIGGSFYKTATTWQEGTITWNNKPALEGNVINSLGSVSSGNWYELDVTNAISGNGEYSFGINSTSSDGADYNSKEASSNKPELIIEF